MLVQLAGHIFLIDSEGVDPGLHEEELGIKHLLEMFASYILVGVVVAVNPHRHDLALKLGEGNHFIADNGDGLVHKAALVFLGGGVPRQGKEH